MARQGTCCRHATLGVQQRARHCGLPGRTAGAEGAESRVQDEKNDLRTLRPALCAPGPGRNVGSCPAAKFARGPEIRAMHGPLLLTLVAPPALPLLLPLGFARPCPCLSCFLGSFLGSLLLFPVLLIQCRSSSPCFHQGCGLAGCPMRGLLLLWRQRAASLRAARLALLRIP